MQNTASSMVSVKDRALAKFENCRSAKDPTNVNNFRTMANIEIEPEVMQKWE